MLETDYFLAIPSEGPLILEWDCEWHEELLVSNTMLCLERYVVSGSI